MTLVLGDADARRRIANELHRRLAVDAGAGSGKTTELISRVVSLVDQGAPISSLAAITFTEAAAAELRTRVRHRLQELADDGERFGRAAREVDDAAICTIHAFALRILSEHWLEAGLPPAVDVLDAAGAYLDHASRWRSFLQELQADQAAVSTLVRAYSAGLSLRPLSEVAGALGEVHDRLSAPVLGRLDEEAAAARAKPPVSLSPVMAALEAALALAARCGDPEDRLYQHLTGRCADALVRLRASEDADEATIIAALNSLGPLSSRRGQASNWGGCVELVRGACEDAEQHRQAILAEVREAAVADLTARLAHFAAEGAAHRRRQGRLSYHDLLAESVALLRHNGAVRRAVRHRYRHLLIDEFQDTDPLQAELAQLLGQPEIAGEHARLFVVGDPAQSIYRFRGADVAQFESMVAELDDRLELTSNFRSVPDILAFVDRVFAELAAEIEDPAGVAHRPLHAVRTHQGDDGAGPAVAVLGGPDGDGLARDVRLRSTAQVAAVLRSVVDQRWTVREASGQRPARFADIAVLLPTRTSLPVLERAMEAAGVPYRLEGATLVWGSQEVRDLLAVLRAADRPGDPLAVVAALRTPALACGDDDLARHAQAGRSWDPRALSDDGAAPGPVGRALAVLARLHEERLWLEPSALVAEVLTDLHFFELALVHRRPRDHWHRLRWVLDQARQFDETGGRSLGDFLDWAETTEDADRWTSGLGPPDADDDAVRVMTIHGSKGLEFPVVLVTGLDAVPPVVPAPILFDADGLPRLRFTKDLAHPGHEALGDDDVRRDRAERFRVLYVALTRARDHLIVDLNHKESGSVSLAHRLFAALQRGAIAPERLDPDPGRRPADELAPPEGTLGASWWQEHARWAAERAAVVASAARQPAWSATALARAAFHRDGPPEHLSGATSTDGDRRRRIGRAVHDALAKVPLPSSGAATDADRAVLATSARANHLDDADAVDALALFEAALGAPSVRRLAAGRHWKELPLAVPVPGGRPGAVLEGFADLVGETDRGLVVADFKTSAPGADADAYLAQVAAYAYALERAAGRPVVEATVVYLTPAGATEVTLAGPDLAGMIERVLDAAAE